MIVVDVNLLVYAWDRRNAQHATAIRWLDGKLSESARVGLPSGMPAGLHARGHESTYLRETGDCQHGVGAGRALANGSQRICARAGQWTPGNTWASPRTARRWRETHPGRASCG